MAKGKLVHMIALPIKDTDEDRALMRVVNKGMRARWMRKRTDYLRALIMADGEALKKGGSNG